MHLDSSFVAAPTESTPIVASQHHSSQPDRDGVLRGSSLDDVGARPTDLFFDPRITTVAPERLVRKLNPGSRFGPGCIDVVVDHDRRPIGVAIVHEAARGRSGIRDSASERDVPAPLL